MDNTRRNRVKCCPETSQCNEWTCPLCQRGRQMLFPNRCGTPNIEAYTTWSEIGSYSRNRNLNKRDPNLDAGRVSYLKVHLTLLFTSGKSLFFCNKKICGISRACVDSGSPTLYIIMIIISGIGYIFMWNVVYCLYQEHCKTIFSNKMIQHVMLGRRVPFI